MANLNEVVNFIEKNYTDLNPVIVKTAKNGGECTGVSVSINGNSNIVWYPDTEEIEIGEAVKVILSLREMAKKSYPINEAIIPKSFEEAKNKLSIGVMNERYSDMLKSHHIITYLIEDLVFYPVVVISDSLSYKVTKDIIKIWGVTEEKVFEAAFASEELNNVELLSVHTIKNDNREEKLFLKEYDPSEFNSLILLLSQGNYQTAGTILSPNIQHKLMELFPEGFLILPSSIYEVLILPYHLYNDIAMEEVKEVVMEINETEVSPDAYLSDSVYTIEKGRIKKVI